MLKWDSDVWGKLTGPYSTADNVPVLLQQLKQEYSQEVFDELFQEHLFHQNTIYTASYAAMPYLAQLACTTSDAEVRKELYINCGIIEASRDGNEVTPFPSSWAELAKDAGSSVCTELYCEYIEAMDKLRALSKEVFAYAAAQQEAIGEQTLARQLRYLAGETTCPSCRENLSVWPALLSTFTM